MESVIKTYESICLTKQQILNKGYLIEDNTITKFDIRVEGHFGNITTLSVQLTNSWLLSTINMELILSNVLKILVEFLRIEKDEGISINDIKNIPIRTILSEDGHIVGIGHNKLDRFIFTDDLLKLAKENLYNRLFNNWLINRDKDTNTN